MSTQARSEVLNGSLYRQGGAEISARTTVTDFNGDTIDCRGLRRISFTAQWTADSGGTRAGRFRVQTTDDPRAISDSANAAWVSRTFQTGSTDGDATVATINATIAATAGIEQFNFVDLPKFIRLIWDNTTAGTDGTVSVWVSGSQDA